MSGGIDIPASEPQLATLANGLRVVTLAQPWRQTLSLSLFVRTGSHHEAPGQNGISHVVEHMAFKGTRTRDCQCINLDAERLGAEVNAHTDKDHTAFHIDGLARDLEVFVPMLADIVLDSTFPADELERERQVILQELAEYDEDPEAIAFQLFDRACWGLHAAAQPVIGRRANIARFTRDDLLAYVTRQYTARNVVVALAGDLDPDRCLRVVEAGFGAMAAGAENAVAAPAWHGGLKLRRMAGSGQTHMVLGFQAPTLADDAHLPYVMAAAVFGEGMSSPLLDQIRERRGLAYYAACSADLLALTGQFVVEASTAPERAGECLGEIARLLRQQAEAPDAVAFERARQQLVVRALRAHEQPARRLEAAVQEVYTHGRPRSTAEHLARLQAVTPDQVQQTFATLLASPPAVALAGSVPARMRERVAALFSPDAATHAPPVARRPLRR
ncbi:Mitochondrial processing peptidase-like protein [Rubrivivax sp. A210]|uniref:M16 family metallopeptidase n=1 Tax=Rubrivivax sp. A210 TaxID=2772301 RepID=UPI001917ECD5|nr:pitrilysin family protein [Rubrivivax sp. A210]CAD5370131.1 Mitochondrial processing peptidase-like protein [Rubrivivax sp. A210]